MHLALHLFLGGLDAVLINLKSPPDPNDPSLVAYRNQATSDIEYEFSVIKLPSSPHKSALLTTVVVKVKMIGNAAMVMPIVAMS